MNVTMDSYSEERVNGASPMILFDHVVRQDKAGKMNLTKTSEQILDDINRSHIKAVRFEFTDVHGIIRCKLVSVHNLKAIADYLNNGVQFPALWICEDTEGKIFDSAVTQKYGSNDICGLPSLDTFTMIPWDQGTARITTVLHHLNMKDLLMEHPRNVANQQVKRLEIMGYTLLCGYELEFRIHDMKSRQPIVNRAISGNTLRLLTAGDYIKHLFECLPKVGVDVDTIHAESPVGSLEVTCKPSFGIKAADEVIMGKNACKEIALGHGYIASFVPSPDESSDVGSLHFNHSLWDKTGNVVYDKTTGSLTETAEHWMAGLLAHAQALTPLMAPSINGIKSFGAYQPASNFEPSFVTWGTHNRSVTFRIKSSGPQGSYIENRIPRSDADPYLILAGTIAAGMDGIINKLPLPPECTGDASKESDIPPLTPRIPFDMEDGITALVKDKVLCEALGEDFIDHIVAVRRHEIKRYNTMAKPEGDEYQGFFDVQ